MGVPWDKKEDTIAVSFPTSIRETAELTEPTKREVLRTLASVFDPLGITTSILLTGRNIFHEIYDSKIPWDKVLPYDLKKNGRNGCKFYLKKFQCQEASLHQPKLVKTSLEVHGFGDATVIGYSAFMYLVIHQDEWINQGLLTAKSRLSKRDLTMPRLELVASHMSSNQVDNVAKAFSGYPITGKFGCSDSSVALHSIRGRGKYKQFVTNRVNKINGKEITWRYVPTNENPTDLGSRGGEASKLTELWLKGPSWLSNPDKVPSDIATKAFEES